MTVLFSYPLESFFLTFSIPWGYFMPSFLLLIFSNLISSFIFPFQLINQLTNSILNPWWLLSWVSKNLKILSVESIIEFGLRKACPLCLNHVEPRDRSGSQTELIKEVKHLGSRRRERRMDLVPVSINGKLYQSSWVRWALESKKGWHFEQNWLYWSGMAHGRKK